MRSYRSLEEAVEEWRRFGITDSVGSALRLMSKVHVFVEGEDDNGLALLADRVEKLRGRQVRCDSREVKRLMVSGSDRFFERLSESSGVPLASLVSASLANFLSAESPPIRTSCGPMTFDATRVMGVLNVTPDSFSDGGVFFAKEDAVRRAFEMADQGADMIDIGGESTRPFSEPVSEEEEMSRILPVISEVAPSLGVPVSVDTRKPSVARKAVEAGAHMVNDVSGLRDPEMIDAVASMDVPVVAMHMRGEPMTMQVGIEYDDVVGDIMRYVSRRIGEAVDMGVREENILIDPGIGFGKEVAHNLDIIRRLREFRSFGLPVVVGSSRKAFIGKVLGLPKDERLEGTLATVAACAINGADIIRVHDVKEAVRVCRMIDAAFRTRSS